MIYIILTYLLSPFAYLAMAIKKKGTVSRVLVIQTAKIGDMICSTPVFREIKKQYPSARLTVIIDPVTKGLLEYNPNVDEMITIKKEDVKGFTGKIKLSNTIRKGRYDVSVCLNPNVPYAVALFWGLVPVRLSIMPDYSGSTFQLVSVFFTSMEKHIRGKMTVETYMNMLKPLGIQSSGMAKEVYRSDTSGIKVRDILGGVKKPLLGIGVSSGNKMKELGPNKIIELTDRLTESTDFNIVLIGSSRDIQITDRILAAVEKRERVINAVGSLNLAELPELIERLSLFIGVDSGITYMADSLDIPLINIAGPADMDDQRPTGDKVIIIQKQLSCVPCSHAYQSPYKCRLGTRMCITDVSVDEIYSAVKKIL